MGKRLDKITVSGFKSIRSLEDFEPRNLNVLIGNGAGEATSSEIFRLLRMLARNLGGYVLSRGGADDFLFNGPKCTKVRKSFISVSTKTSMVFRSNRQPTRNF